MVGKFTVRAENGQTPAIRKALKSSRYGLVFHCLNDFHRYFFGCFTHGERISTEEKRTSETKEKETEGIRKRKMIFTGENEQQQKSRKCRGVAQLFLLFIHNPIFVIVFSTGKISIPATTSPTATATPSVFPEEWQSTSFS
jgi:hypothetical protein